MGYCFSCGRLSDTIAGLCSQCRDDERLRRQGNGDLFELEEGKGQANERIKKESSQKK